MNIQYLANLAEISSGIIVVVTLIFLVVQIRDNTKALRNTAIESFYNSYFEMAADANRVPELATAIKKAFTSEAMDSIDNHHLCTYIQRTCGLVERGLIMVGSGILSQDDFDMATLPAKTVLATPASRHWYYFLKDKRKLFRPELHAFMDDFYRELDAESVDKNQVAGDNETGPE